MRITAGALVALMSISHVAMAQAPQTPQYALPPGQVPISAQEYDLMMAYLAGGRNEIADQLLAGMKSTVSARRTTCPVPTPAPAPAPTTPSTTTPAN